MQQDADAKSDHLVDPLSDEADGGLYSRPMPDRHLMTDIETLDVERTATILQIAAVTFDPRGTGTEGEDEWSTTITVTSNENHGRTSSQSTINWWSQQSKQARDAVFGGAQMELSKALRSYTRWINMLRPTCTRVWAKDPDFDVAILSHACKELGIMWPFKFWEGRSCRTAMEMAYPEGDFPKMLFDGPEHDAVVDCKKQALEIQHAYYVLGC